jgi:hypothetical protein
MPEIGTSGSMSGDGKRGVAEWPKLPRPSSTLPITTKPATLHNGREGPTTAASRCSKMPFAVGTRVTSRPPHRSVRAAFPHTAPTSGV